MVVVNVRLFHAVSGAIEKEKKSLAEKNERSSPLTDGLEQAKFKCAHRHVVIN